MKPLISLALFLSTLFLSSHALADDDCTDPVADWQPREVLRQQLEQKGWTVQHIRIDDGCYEAKGINSDGNRFKATYRPSSLQMIELKIKFDDDGHHERNKKSHGRVKPSKHDD